MGIILALLILSAPCYWLQMYFFTNTVQPNTNPKTSSIATTVFYEGTVARVFVFEGLNFAFFSVAHWIFAILMWFSSVKMS
jgi:hypothetical protein